MCIQMDVDVCSHSVPDSTVQNFVICHAASRGWPAPCPRIARTLSAEHLCCVCKISVLVVMPRSLIMSPRSHDVSFLVVAADGSVLMVKKMASNALWHFISADLSR